MTTVLFSDDIITVRLLGGAACQVYRCCGNRVARVAERGGPCCPWSVERVGPSPLEAFAATRGGQL